MLKISFAYGHTGNDSDNLFWYVNADSAVAYAAQALQEAKESRYLRGMANAFENLGEMAARENYESGENYFRQALSLYNKINDFNNGTWSDLWLGYYLMYEGKFAEARTFYTNGLSYYQKVGNMARQARTYGLLGNSFILEGYYTKALQFVLKDIGILQSQIRYQNDPITSGVRLAELSIAAGDTANALEYFQHSAGYAKAYNTDDYFDLRATINFLQHNYDSALYYRKLQDSSANNADIGEIYLLTKDYPKALPYFLNNLLFVKRLHNTNYLLELLDDIAKDYFYQRNMKASLTYAVQVYKKAKEIHAREFIKEGNWLMWKIYDAEKNTDSAYKYHLQFDIINDSIARDQLTRDLAVTQMKFDDEKKQSQIDLLKKDNQINHQQLKTQSTQKNMLIAAMLVLVFLCFILLRVFTLKRKNEILEKNRLQYLLDMEHFENEKKQSELQNKATELEMQALRAQMNPHFIFNCLSSINHFILKNKTEEASKYLTKFSRLIRMVLNNSMRTFIAFEDEMETLRLYLDMERLRFKNSFEYSFTFNNSIDAGNIFIPPLLIQPFAENAIWHGLMLKDEGLLSFDFSVEDSFLTCVITDNGIGRIKAATLKSKSAVKQKSMGLKITAERLSLLNNNAAEQTVFTIEDLTDENGNASGTRVYLKIVYKKMMEL